MKFIDKVSSADIELFAKCYLIGKNAKLNTLNLQVEFLKGGWFVEHNFKADNGKIAKEGYLFSDFSVVYFVGECNEVVPNNVYMCGVQGKFHAFMSSRFGREYNVALCKKKYGEEFYIPHSKEQAVEQNESNIDDCSREAETNRIQEPVKTNGATLERGN